MRSTADLQDLYGRTVVDGSGDKIGKVKDVYRSDSEGDGAFITVSTGMFGTKSSFVPLSAVTRSGDDIAIPYDKQLVKDAPRIDDDEELSSEEESRLYDHYSLTAEQIAHERPTGQTQGARGRDVSGPATDDAMTRSEEQLQVGTQTREAGRARLVKYIVTENQTQTVPVSHEEVRVEREPITADNRDAATSGAALSEEEHEVVLHEERPVVGKETVPVERVRLGTEQVSGEETVSEDVSHEVIELRDQADADRR